MDLIDKRDEVLRIFLEYGITENKENDLTKTDLADCAEKIVEKLILSSVGEQLLCIDEQDFEGQITKDRKYTLIKEDKNHYYITNDLGYFFGYHKKRFVKL